MKAVAIGLAALAVITAPGIAFALLGYWLWGDGGQLLAVLPYFVGLLILGALLIGETVIGQRERR